MLNNTCKGGGKMIIIGCGTCGGKYQIIASNFNEPHCPSCGEGLPEKMRTSIKTLIEESKNRPNWKMLVEFGNMFNVDLTLKIK